MDWTTGPDPHFQSIFTYGFGQFLGSTITFLANYDGRKDVLSDLATDHHVTRREAADALKARNSPAQGKQR